jgi:hypothetical protein
LSGFSNPAPHEHDVSYQRSTAPPPPFSELDALLLDYVIDEALAARRVPERVERPGREHWSFERAASRHSRIGRSNVPWFASTRKGRTGT